MNSSSGSSSSSSSSSSAGANLISLKNYKCAVCHMPSQSISELHSHQSFFHTSEELSLAIINFPHFLKAELERDFIVIGEDSRFSNKENVENYGLSVAVKNANGKDVNHNSQAVVAPEYYQNYSQQQQDLSPKLDDDDDEEEGGLEENNEFMCQSQQQNDSKSQPGNLQKPIFSSIKSENQDYFQFWESELNKPLNMFNDEFSVSITNLCQDLKNPKCRAPKRIKKKMKIFCKEKRKYRKRNQDLGEDKEIKFSIKREMEDYDSVMTNTQGRNFQVEETQISNGLVEAFAESSMLDSAPVFQVSSPNLDQYLDFNDELLKIFDHHNH